MNRPPWERDPEATTRPCDHENRLTQSLVGGKTSSSEYHGTGVCRSHIVSGSTTTYVWDVNAGLPVVLQDRTRTYVYGLDLISATDGSGNQAYFSYDAVGSVTDLTNGAGAVTGTYVYDVFGTITSRSGPSTSYWLFTGEQQDRASGDSGYYVLRARYYDPALGRFISRDPLLFEQRYSYTGNNPLTYVDPSGLRSTLGFVDCWTEDLIDWGKGVVADPSNHADVIIAGGLALCAAGGLLCEFGAALAVFGFTLKIIAVRDKLVNGESVCWEAIQIVADLAGGVVDTSVALADAAIDAAVLDAAEALAEDAC